MHLDNIVFMDTQIVLENSTIRELFPISSHMTLTARELELES